MTEAISIWRFQVTEDLEALFARCVAASDAAFRDLVDELMAQGVTQDLPAPDQVFHDAVAKVKAMGLPEAQLAATLAGLEQMRAEADATWAPEEAAAGGDQPQIGLPLASSHMFVDAPFAQMEDAQIIEQVNAALAQYCASLSAVLGDEGQGLHAYLGIPFDALIEPAVFQILMAADMAEVHRLWIDGARVHVLSVLQEDKELPIDLELFRVPLADFEALKRQVAGVREM